MAMATLRLALGEVYEPEAVAEALKVGKGTVYRLIHSKKLHAYKVGVQYRIPASAVYEYLGIETGQLSPAEATAA